MRLFIGRSIAASCDSKAIEDFKYCSRDDAVCRVDLLEKRLDLAVTLAQWGVRGYHETLKCFDTYVDLAEKTEKIILESEPDFRGL